MKRLECLNQLGPLIKDDDLVVTTLGWVAGEWFAVRHKESNLYQVNMGMCTPLCLGLALVLPHRRVVAIESDGSVPTATAGVTDLAAMANGAGIENSCSVSSLDEFEREARAALQRKGPNYIVAKVEAAGKRMSTDMDGKEGKYRFVRYIERTEKIKIIGTAAK
jgi:thiamine pyrophosphate-dependent acetolactate synthase large subunit-like protein